MKIRSRHQAAFTLIELLVVITIIGILAGIALPALSTAQLSAQQTKALANARSIVTALRAYASDNDGVFPAKRIDATGTVTDTDFATSNEAFRVLFPTYLTNEQIFWVPKDKWCNVAKPDDVFDAQNSDSTKTLAKGENHWAYVKGLSDSSNSSLPLVADAFTTPGIITSGAKYSNLSTDKGGVWQGKIAIIVHVDQSAEKVKPDQTTFKVMRKDANGAAANYFDVVAGDAYWLQTGQNPVDPDPAT